MKLDWLSKPSSIPRAVAVGFLVAALWVIAQLSVAGVLDVILAVLLLIAWLLHRIERTAHDSGAATVKQLVRLESDGELVRDWVEGIHTSLNDGLNVEQIHTELREVRQTLDDIRGELRER